MTISNIVQLGFKEYRSLLRDPIMMALIVFAFTVQIYTTATAMPEMLHKAPIVIVDLDQSAVSQRIRDAFYPPQFIKYVTTSQAKMDSGMDEGLYTFGLNIPPDFQRNLLSGRKPTLQLNIDATRMSQAFTGTAYIQTIIEREINEFVEHYRSVKTPPVDLAVRVRFNPTLTKIWFGALMELINNVTMLSIVLTGAALLREREHGTIEHLLVMPVTPFEIMASKIWAMASIVLIVCAVSLITVVQGLLSAPIEGSILLFLLGAAINLFATTSIGIFMGTITRSMPQFGILLILVLLPLEMLSGGLTPRESMPEFVQTMMLVAPNTHFVMLAQSILFRGAGFGIVWPQFLTLAIIGSIFFMTTLMYFRKRIVLLST
ncbi:TPA: ABC-2 transporter permease [Legionella pneumophila]|uniref:ABC transporter permease n=1 Tax=Legionella pneumophila TaxID=446 RepID=UPI001A2C50E6|nr:ABC transporter permease [Legionella pneumophila]MDI9826334.1 ABC transporter permease [Legionella pneumophila]HAU0908739.1 ABC-2 transporter permease [Legionella pneumophila]HAU1359110.1 ABC-2 transporter permease [Legionella pneumophila]HAU1458275.1 ABC-2 transporter permease [Legionella pneumophila]HBD7168419.1 ABC-2 transporter permease [Legionella pneumophila]